MDDAFLYLERSRSRNFQDRVLREDSTENKQLTIQEVRSRIDPRMALIEYWTAGDQIAVIWCSRQQTRVAFQKIDSRSETEIREALDSLSEGSADWRTKLAAVAQLLPVEWVQAQPEIGHLLIVPDNWISQIPFEVLPIESDGGRLLIDRVAIAYAPSAVLLRRKLRGADRKFPWNRQLVAFGEPVIEEKPGLTNQIAGEAPQALPFSKEEVESIASLVPGESQLFLGGENRKSVFLSGESNSAPLLHVSTHAYADASNPEDSRLLFSSESSNGDYLYLRELYGVNLSHVSLAVLSACDTEHGKLVRGEGVQAFSRALLAAGAESSVTTLWKVDDRATAEFMKQFYFFAVKRGLPRSEALRQAKLKFLHSNTELEKPKYWAAFVLSGESLSPVPAVVAWGTLILASLIALAIVLALGIGLARRRGNHRQNYP